MKKLLLFLIIVALIGISGFYIYQKVSRKGIFLSKFNNQSGRIEFDESCIPSDIHQNKGVCLGVDGEIYLLDLSSGKRAQITNIKSNKSYAKIYGDYIVWLDGRNKEVAGTETRYETQGPFQENIIGKDIYLYNLKTKDEKKITTNPAMRYQLQLYGNHIAWTEKRGTLTSSNYYNSELHVYDILLDKEVFSSIFPSAKEGLHLWGDKLVWADSRNGRNTGCGNCPDNRFDIYLYDFGKGQERPLIESQYLKTDPNIYDNMLVWSDYRNNQSDIYLMDLKTGKETQLTQTKDSEVSPLIFQDKVVWIVRSSCDARPVFGETGVYAYDLKTNKVDKLTSYVEPSAQLYDNLVVIHEGCMIQGKVYGIYLK